MAPRTIAERRLFNQGITGAGLPQPATVVSRLGAVQAQEYEAAKWALGLRMRDGASDADVERAFERGDILRTHVMRPTWHFVARDDIRWLLELTAPRVHRVLASYCRRSELDRRTLVRAAAIFERALGDHHHLTRVELRDRLQRGKIVAAGVRLAFLTIFAELEGVICSGPRRGKQFTYALVAERAPLPRRMDRDQALGELSARYFASHGPATIRDFVWWSGLTSADAKRGLNIIKARRDDIDGTAYWSLESSGGREGRPGGVHLLPIYDEYLVAYRDRAAVPHGPDMFASANKRPGTHQHTLVIAGQVAGTWMPAAGTRPVAVTALRALTDQERGALDLAIGRYDEFREARRPDGDYGSGDSTRAQP